MNLKHSLAAVALFAGVPISLTLADRTPTDAKPIVEIVEQLEKTGYGPFIEISTDDGHWEVEVYKNDAAYELSVDYRTGEVLSERRDDSEPRPPHDARLLSEILRGMIKSGDGDIDEISFERRYWEIEVYRNDGQHEVHVDPKTGELVSDRRDD